MNAPHALAGGQDHPAVVSTADETAPRSDGPTGIAPRVEHVAATAAGEAAKPRRNRTSARKAGTSFERTIADYLATQLDDRIDRRAKTGSKDRGDIGGLRHLGQRIVAEAKNTHRIDLAGWMKEAETERGNDDAGVALVIHKRHGRGDPADQWVTCTVRDLVSLLSGTRPEDPS